MRKSIVFTLVTMVNIVLVVLVALHANHSQTGAVTGQQERTALAKTLQLTDLCLFTEARYTRHPAMADRFAPFQDHPGAMEHFPSGSLVTPPSPYNRDKCVNEVIFRQKNAENNFSLTK